MCLQMTCPIRMKRYDADGPPGNPRNVLQGSNVPVWQSHGLLSPEPENHCRESPALLFEHGRDLMVALCLGVLKRGAAVPVRNATVGASIEQQFH